MLIDSIAPQIVAPGKDTIVYCQNEVDKHRIFAEWVNKRANAVIRIEDTHINGNEIHFNVKQLKENQNIAIQGEDARKGDLLIKKGTKLNPNSISLLAVTGHAKLEVYKLPIIAIVSTGNEIVAVESVIQPHQIRDSNVHTLKNSLLNYCISAIQTALIVDD